MDHLKKIRKLVKLGMTTKEATLFVREIAQEWYRFGWDDGMEDVVESFADIQPFDTQFSKALTPKATKK